MSPQYRIFVRSGAVVVDPPPPTGGVLTRAEREAIPFSAVKTQGSTLAAMQNFMARYTGLLPGITLTQLPENTSFTTSSDGQIIENYEIRGPVNVNHANVTIRNCWIRNRPVRDNSIGFQFINVNSATANLLVEDCQIGPQRDGLSYRADGIRTRGYTAKRCRLQATTDGFAIINDSAGLANVNIWGCWVENMCKVCPDFGDGGPATGAAGTHSDGTHNDGIQIQGGSNVHVQGCLLQGRINPTVGNTGGRNIQPGGAQDSCLERTDWGVPCTQTNAAFQWNDNNGVITNCVVEDNWLDGGINTCNGGGLTRTTDVITFRNNKFTRRVSTTGLNTTAAGQYLPVTGTGSIRPINFSAAPVVTISGNTYDDGTAVELTGSG